MAMSRLMITLSCLAALTFVSDASSFAKGVIYTILCTIARIDWSDDITSKTTGNALPETETESVAVDVPATPLDIDSQAVENICVDHGDAGEVVDPTIGSLPILDTASQDTKHRSRASSISSTTSLFDKPTSNDRPSTPDTDIGDIPEFSTLAAKYQDDPAAINTEYHTEVLNPVTPSESDRPPPPSPSTSMTKYSMKPAELVHAVDDFSMPTPLPTATSNKRKLDTLEHHEAKIAGESHNMDVTKATAPAQNTATAEQITVPKKKKKLNSRQRRQRALRQVAGTVGPSPLSQVE